MAVELYRLNEDIFFGNFREKFFLQNFIQEKIFEFSESIIVVLNDKKQIISCSGKFEELFENKDVYGENFIHLMNEITRLPDDFFKEKSYFIKINSTQNVYKAEIAKYEADSIKSNRYVIILKDVSDKKEMQIEKDNFIATLTHDLKTPVRAGILSLDLLLKGKFGELNEEQKEIINEILNSNKFMLNMIDTLLSKYKYENKEVNLNKTVFDMNEFLKVSVKELHCLFEEKNLCCEMNLCVDKVNILADKIELRRAFSNFLSNAIKFNNKQGKVIITTQKKNNCVVINIKDTGIGMSKDKLEHIFDKYVSYAKKFRRLGTGLGLYVAKKIIQSHSGNIEVSSEINKGSIFTITLPLKN